MAFYVNTRDQVNLEECVASDSLTNSNIPPMLCGYRFLFPARPLPWVFSENTEQSKTISLTVTVSAVLFPS